MNLLKKFLRGIYYFCVGVQAFLRDLSDWYTHNRAIPRFLRHPVVPLVAVIALIGCSCGLAASIGSSSIEERHIPSSSQAAPTTSEPETSEPETSEPETSEPETSEPETSEPEASEPEETQPAEPDFARADQLSNDQLRQVLQERVEEYYAGGSGTVFIPPAAGDIAGWQAVNPDVRAWITIPNTNISYPVVIGPYTDYYTHLGYYKEASRNGVIWFDTDVKFDSTGEITSRNAVIYGHNWTNCWRPVRIGNPSDVMFAQLAAYDDASFTAQNPYIRITTPGGDHLYQVFSVFYTDLSFVYVYCDGSIVDSIISRAKALDIHNLNVPVSSSDQIITLSTCTRVLGAGDNQRFVVMAKKIS